MNITITQPGEIFPGITETCWKWCQEQAVIHQSNIDISNLGVVVVALIAILAYQIIIDCSDEICDYLKVDEYKLNRLANFLLTLAYMLLIVFLGYYAIFV